MKTAAITKAMLRLLLLLLVVFGAPTAHAEDTADIDADITNSKLRAESGSKSTWSMKANINYNGGNLEVPFGPVRPNYAAVSSQNNNTSFAGTVAAAYRWDKSDTVRAGTGVLLLTPFQNTIEDVENARGVRKSNISDPYIEYSRAMKLRGYQNIFTAHVTDFTQSAYTTKGYVSLIDLNHTALYTVSGNSFEIGLNGDFNYTFFNNAADATDTRLNAESGRSDYTIALYPFIEYAMNDRYSLRTVFRFLTFDHYRSDDSTTFLRELYTQSVGIGIAVTRDIYLYPNMQFAPENLKAGLTNIGLSTTINVF